MNDIRIGIDIGGTNTDFVVAVGEDVRRYKTPSTDWLPEGVLTGLDKAASDFELDRKTLLNRTKTLIHGTTATTNALLERTEATTGLLTTHGFRDLVEHNTQSSNELYSLDKETAKLVPPRHLRRTIPERVDREGRVVESLEDSVVQMEIEELIDDGVEAISVAFMNAHLNPVHEEKVLQIASDYESIAWSFSTNILSQIGLYDRIVATTVNASLKPVIREYMIDLESEFEEAGFEGTLLIMQGNGGVSPVGTVIEHPITTVNSGPAAGTTAVAQITETTDTSKAISFDMGGTSSDVCLVRDHDPLVSEEGEIGEARLPISMVDINTIGAGGGSIAWIDDRQIMRIGPKSAGADPGPVCYDKGGEEPTVTDANLLLGYLNPEYFLGGSKSLAVSKTRDAIEEHLAEPLNMSVDEVAAGIHNLANEELINQIRQVSINRGLDAREFDLVAFGGAGPTHAAALARRFETDVLIPGAAGTLSALGLLQSDVKHNFVRSVAKTLSAKLLEEINGLYDEMEKSARQLLKEEGFGSHEWRFEYTLDTRYSGQVHDINITIPEDSMSEVEVVKNRHHIKHEDLYTFKEEGSSIEVINARLKASAITKTTLLSKMDTTQSGQPIKEHREVYFHTLKERVDTPIYDMYAPPDDSIQGPAIFEGPHTSVLIPSDFTIRAEKKDNYYRLAQN